MFGWKEGRSKDSSVAGGGIGSGRLRQDLGERKVSIWVGRDSEIPGTFLLPGTYKDNGRGGGGRVIMCTRAWMGIPCPHFLQD